MRNATEKDTSFSKLLIILLKIYILPLQLIKVFIRPHLEYAQLPQFRFRAFSGP